MAWNDEAMRPDASVGERVSVMLLNLILEQCLDVLKGQSALSWTGEDGNLPDPSWLCHVAIFAAAHTTLVDESRTASTNL